MKKIEAIIYTLPEKYEGYYYTNFGNKNVPLF